MSQILVSAIITTHNRIELLKRAIDSVLNQTYKNIECIVIDDASDDGTEDYCRSLSNIVYVRINKNESKGGNYARNLGIKMSNGKYVAFLDDDDYWLPKKIELQVSLIELKGNKVVHCGIRYEYVGRNLVYKDVLPNYDHVGDISRKILMINTTTTSCLMIAKDAFTIIGDFDERLRCCQEYELTIRLAQISDFYFVPEPLIVYRDNCKDRKRITNTFSIWLESIKYIYEKHRSLYKKMTLYQFLFFVTRSFKDGSDRMCRSGMFKGFVYTPISYILFFPFRTIMYIKKNRILSKK